MIEVNFFGLTCMLLALMCIGNLIISLPYTIEPSYEVRKRVLKVAIVANITIPAFIYGSFFISKFYGI